MSTSTDLDTNITRTCLCNLPNYYGRSYGVSPYYQNIIIMAILTNQLIGYDRDLNTYKEGTLRLSLVDSKTKNIVWKARPQTVI
jgi:hypothetical protein